MKQFICAVLLVAVAVGSGPAAANDPVAGRKLAVSLCSGCHLVAPDQSGPVSDGVPAFAALARDKRKTDDSLRAFVLDPHPPMPRVQLTATELDAIVAYIRSLGGE